MKYSVASLGLLCLFVASATAAIQMTPPTLTVFVKPNPLYFSYTITSPLPTAIAASRFFLNYTVAAPCTQPVIPAYGCGTCADGVLDVAQYTYACNCSIVDLSTVSTATDGCLFTVNTYENSTNSQASGAVGYLLAAAPNVTSVSLLSGANYIDLSSSANVSVRIQGTDLASSFATPQISLGLFRIGSSIPCETVNTFGVSVVSRSEVRVDIGRPTSQFSGSDGCELSLVSFARSVFGVNATSIPTTKFTSLFPPVFASNITNNLLSISNVADAYTINAVLGGSYLPIDSTQVDPKFNFSLTGGAVCTAATISGHAVIPSSASAAAGAVMVTSTSTINNCILNVVARRYNIVFGSVAIGTVADVLLGTPSYGLFRSVSNQWTIFLPTPRDVNPQGNPFYLEWTPVNVQDTSPCAPDGTIANGNLTFNGCPGAVFNASGITCVLPARVAADGCRLRARFFRSPTASSGLVNVGILSTASVSVRSASANSYFAGDNFALALDLVVGQAGVGGSVTYLNSVSIDITGDGCSGAATGTFPDICDSFLEITHANGATSLRCSIPMSAVGSFSVADDDTLCNVVFSANADGYGNFVSTVGTMVRRRPSITGPDFRANGFVSSGIVVQFAGSALPLASEPYSIRAESLPSGCFVPTGNLLSGRCSAGGPSASSRAGFDCLINGTFSTDPCIVCLSIARFNSSNLASDIFSVATHIVKIPAVVPVIPTVRTFTPSILQSVVFLTTNLNLTGSTRTTSLAYCGSSSVVCSITQELEVNATHTEITCDLTLTAAEFDNCVVEFSVARFGVYGPRSGLFRSIFVPDITAYDAGTYGPNVGSLLQNFNLTISGQFFPRTDEPFSAVIKFACNASADTPCRSVTIVESGSSFLCNFDVPLRANNCGVQAIVTRYGAPSALEQVGFLVNDALVVFPPKPIGINASAVAPFTLPIKGYSFELLTYRSVALRFYNGANCYTFVSGVNYTVCDPAASTFDANTYYCRVSTVITAARVGCPIFGAYYDLWKDWTWT